MLWSFVLFVLAVLLVPVFHHLGFFWEGRRAAFVSVAEAQGMKVVTGPHFAQAEARLPGGGRLVIILRFAEGKHRYYELNGSLTLKGCPKDLTLRAESLWTGFNRLVGAQESLIEDQVIDAAFWVDCPNTEEFESYLTPNRRRGLLEILARLPKFWVEKGRLQVEQWYVLPWGDRRRLCKMLGNFSDLDDALNGKAEKLASKPERTGNIQAIRVRQSLPASSLLLFWVFGLGAMTGGVVSQIFMAFTLLGYALLALALTGVRVGRVLLQGYFAFSTLALILYVVAGCLALYENPIPDTPVAYYLICLISAVFTWAMRHFLKDLIPDRTRNTEVGL